MSSECLKRIENDLIRASIAFGLSSGIMAMTPDKIDIAWVTVKSFTSLSYDGDRIASI
jgi:hypothetical protein